MSPVLGTRCPGQQDDRQPEERAGAPIFALYVVCHRSGTSGSGGCRHQQLTNPAHSIEER
ncbi:MAG TPA: hypothetical protein VGG38_21235 [Acidimicrobiales bacterium]